jgi:bacterioferritin-associated ferredoxin
MIIIRIPGDAMFVCLCNPVTDGQIRRCVRQGACTLSDLQMQLGVAAQCGMCASSALAIIHEEAANTGSATGADMNNARSPHVRIDTVSFGL